MGERQVGKVEHGWEGWSKWGKDGGGARGEGTTLRRGKTCEVGGTHLNTSSRWGEEKVCFN